ncbi:MAG TPA: acyl-CoA dehydrogenase family protein [Micromonosporaceae bacterium]
MVDVLDRARRIADDVLFPAALRVESGPGVPREHLDLLAAEGFYGLPAPAEVGGLGVTDLPTAARVVEILADGCLTTTFVWLQHLASVRAVAASDRPGIRDTWLVPLATGRRRAGVVQAALRPGPPTVRATGYDGGYLFDGDAQWVTGWGMIDTLYAAARDEHGALVWALLDAVPDDSLRIETLDMAVLSASRTVTARFVSHLVPRARVVAVVPGEDWSRQPAAGLRMNGSLALGVAARCCTLLGPGPFDAALDECRAALDAAAAPDAQPGADDATAHARADGATVRAPADEAMARARAAASDLALRAAAALAVGTGARAVRVDQHAQRLLREALFLLVFGSRPAIRAALLDRLTGGAGGTASTRA